jgi:hypothetical protein
MSIRKAFISFLVCNLLVMSCAYIVLPEEEEILTSIESKGWSAVATNIGASEDGGLHIDLALQNLTFDWSAMQAAADKPALLIAPDGKTSSCDTVRVSTGGHRLAPGFQMRGFTAGTKAQPETQLIYVECAGAQAAPGSKLSIDYSYVIGEYNYYYPEENKTNATLEVDLDQIAADLKYPVDEPMEGLILNSDVEITAINKAALTLAQVERTATGLQFTWHAANPGEYPSYVHIGIPPVIGEDGILYGLYESPDIASVPILPAGDAAEWTTTVAVPDNVKGLVILLSVESKKQRLFTNYALDITGD